MKKILLLIAMALCFSQYATSQESLPQIAVIKQAFNEKNITLLDGIIADDCTILGRSDADFKSTCEAVFARLANDTIVDMTLLGTERIADGITSYTYSITYSALGKKKGIFNVNSEGKVTRLDYLSGERAVSSTDVRHVRSLSATAAKSPLIKLPFQVGDNNLIVFRGELNGEVKNFILDSGAEHSVINSKRLNKDLKFGKAVLKGVDGAAKTGLAVADSNDINISGIQLNNASIFAKDLSYLEPTGVEISAVIGMDILGAYDIMYDYANGELTLFNPQVKFKLRASSATTIPYTDLARNFLPCIKVKVGDNELVFGIDCGATGNLIVPKYEGIVSDNHETNLVGIAGVSSKSKQGKLSYGVAGLKFDDQDFVVKDISNLGLAIDGLLGYQFLKTKKMLFRNSTKELIIF